MQLSKSCIYALRSLVYIGQNATQQHKLGIKEIAEELDLPSHFLSKILQRLVKHEIVQSVKGSAWWILFKRKIKRNNTSNNYRSNRWIMHFLPIVD
jgi:DNA-binding IclR family transcriptional regulator